MPGLLAKEEVVAIEVMAQKGVPNTAIAQTMGVTEGAVRYHLHRQAEGAVDGRADKAFKASAVADAITAWVAAEGDHGRPANMAELFEFLVAERGFTGSYSAVKRFARRVYGRPPVRTYRRVETPPGAQAQTDWGEFPAVDVGDGLQRLHAFVMALSHSRKTAVVWSRREDQVSWLARHNDAFRRLGGIPASNRIDNVKTAIACGAGAWGEIHPVYRTYARALGFHVDACAPRTPNAKGKVEAKVRLARLRVDPGGRHFGSLEELQAWTDARMEAWSERALCPATGKTVRESWEAERPKLRPLPEALPEPFDVVVTRPVQRDCMVAFEGRHYPVPFAWVGRRVEVRGCAGTVEIWAEGARLRSHPRHTEERVIVDPTCYEGPPTLGAIPPPPLGKLGQRLEEIAAMPVDRRPLDLYAALAEVAR